MSMYRVIAEIPEVITGPDTADTWEGQADDKTDAVMQSGFDKDLVIDVEEIEDSPIAKELKKLEDHEGVIVGNNPAFEQPDEKTSFTADELLDIEAKALRHVEAQKAVDEHFEDKKIMGIATNLAALHLDTAIEAEKMLFYHWTEAKRKLLEAIEIEGMEAIEDITLKLRVSVMVQPKGTMAAADGE